MNQAAGPSMPERDETACAELLALLADWDALASLCADVVPEESFAAVRHGETWSRTERTFFNAVRKDAVPSLGAALALLIVHATFQWEEWDPSELSPLSREESLEKWKTRWVPEFMGSHSVMGLRPGTPSDLETRVESLPDRASSNWRYWPEDFLRRVLPDPIHLTVWFAFGRTSDSSSLSVTSQEHVFFYSGIVE